MTPSLSMTPESVDMKSEKMIFPVNLCNCCCVVDVFIDLMLLSEVVESLETSGINQTCGPLCWAQGSSQQRDENNNMSLLSVAVSRFLVQQYIIFTFC